MSPKASIDALAAATLPAELGAAASTHSRHDWHETPESGQAARDQGGQPDQSEAESSGWQQRQGQRQHACHISMQQRSRQGGYCGTSAAVAQPLPVQPMRWSENCSSSSDSSQPHKVRNEAWLAAVARQGVLALEAVPPSLPHSDGAGQCRSRSAVSEGQVAMTAPLSNCDSLPASGHGATERQLAAGGWLAANGFGNLAHLEGIQGVQGSRSNAVGSQSQQHVHGLQQRHPQTQKRSYDDFQCDEYQGRLGTFGSTRDAMVADGCLRIHDGQQAQTNEGLPLQCGSMLSMPGESRQNPTSPLLTAC